MKKIIGIICVIAFAGLLIWGAQKNPFNLGSSNSDNSNNNSIADKIDIEWETDEKEEKRVSIFDYNLEDYVKLGDYKNLITEVKYQEVDEAFVTENINKTLEKYPDYTKAKKVIVEKGDIVNIDYKGKVDGNSFEGGSDKGAHLKIGSGDFIEGFEDGLIGARAGQEVVLNLTFPEEYDEELAGKEVQFTVNVNYIEEEKILTCDELTDDFVKENLGFDSIKELREYVEEYFTEKTQSDKTSNTRTSVVDAVIAISEVSVPRALLEGKVAEYLASFKEGVESTGNATLETYIQQNYNCTVEQFGKNVAEMMEKSLKEQMVLYMISQKEDMQADEEGFDEYVDSFVNYYGYSKKEELYKDYPEEELNLAYVCNMVVDYLVENSTINYVEQ